MNTIRVLLVYDTEIMNSSARFPMPQTITDTIAKANQIYNNSQVNQALVLQDTLILNLTEGQSSELAGTITNYYGCLATAKAALANIQPNQPFYVSPEVLDALDQIVTKRKNVTADVVVFWRGRATPPGVARCIAAVPHDAYVCVTDSAIDGWTLAHEIGHLQGINHIDAWYSAYATTTGYCTVMASPENPPNVNKTGVEYFSNPLITTTLPDGNRYTLGTPFVFDSAAKLNTSAPLFAQFGNQLDQPYTPREEPVQLADVALGDRGEMWVVDTGGTPWQWTWGDTYWRKRALPSNGKSAQIAVGNPGAIWCLQKDGTLLQYQNGAWAVVATNGTPQLLSVGTDGTVIYFGQDGSYHQLQSGGSWASWDATYKAVKLAVAGNGKFWIIDSDNHIWSFNSSQNPTWTAPNPTMQALDIAAGANGNLWIINEQQQLAASTDGGQNWALPQETVPYVSRNDNPVPGALAKQISLVDQSRGIKLNPDGTLWRKATTAGDWLQITWHYFTHPDQQDTWS